MTQVSRNKLDKETSEKIFKIFLHTLLNIQKRSEAEQLITDFLTPTERVMLAKRLGIAFFLEKAYTYKEIEQKLNVSTATIAQVNKARLHGTNGYSKFIRKILKDERIELLFNELAINVTSILSHGKGSGYWKYINKKLKSKK